uniref:ATP synthase complex subunit 8 n=1 Tax=Ampithoe lacertosa TaxID=429030 RepID=A0A5P9W9G2_9CRUS|nr:ATP synthase F0 subunit 8 [Ampithoe lacertosa]QFX74898.1 ATP synthase F0 subunit 8 [Ampithoe lacertosa]
MPQMAPTIWLNMMFWMLIMVMILTIIIYFSSNTKTMESFLKSTKVETKKLSW